MANRRTAIIYIFMILKTTSSFPLQYDRQAQSSAETVNSVSSNYESTNTLLSANSIFTNNTLSSVNSASASGPRFSTYAIIGMGIGGVLAVVGILALPAVLGFTAGGIAATSAGAAMMSSSAVASGGGVAAGSLVALLQSAGVLGVTASTGGLVATASAGTIGASVGYGLGYATDKFSKPVAVFFKNTYYAAHNGTVVFFTSNGTTSWNSFTNWTNHASFKIKNGTIDTWKKVKDGTTDAWKTLSNWTIVNTAKVKNQIASWGSSSAAASASSGTPIIILLSVVYNLIGTQYCIRAQAIFANIRAVG